jgi:hypothetical protein
MTQRADIITLLNIVVARAIVFCESAPLKGHTVNAHQRHSFQLAFVQLYDAVRALCEIHREAEKLAAVVRKIRDNG